MQDLKAESVRSIWVGRSQISSSSNEDGYCVTPSSIILPSLSLFSVFDGHGGSLAAELCSEVWHNRIVEKYCEFVNNEHGNPSTAERLCEQLLCQAIRNVSETIDNDIKSRSDSGTTMVSVLCFAEADGSKRIICPWIGDSRCVMYLTQFPGKVKAVPMTEDHKPSLDRENTRITSNLAGPWLGRPVELHDQSKQFSVMFRDSLIKSQVNVEYEGKKSLQKQLTGELSELSTDSNAQYWCGLESQMYESVLTSTDVETTNQNIDENCPYEMIHRKSFINRRTSDKNPKIIGPVAVFSRYDVSLTMTRSIGDKYGPRCCIAQPDISAITIKPNEYARIVLASDGLWDVMSTTQVQEVISKIKEPQEAAHTLADLAYQLRIRYRIRKDDITVIVVDIHPSFVISPVKSGNCLGKSGCTVS